MLLTLMNSVYVNPEQIRYILPGTDVLVIKFIDGTVEKFPYPKEVAILNSTRKIRQEIEWSINHLLYQQAEAQERAKK